MATKLPSGKFRSQIFIGYDSNKKRLYETFIADTEDEADFMALDYKLNHKGELSKSSLTVGAAIDKYIENRTAVLSPTTIREYKLERKLYFSSIKDLVLKKITQEDVQVWVNELAAKYKWKVVHNSHALLSATASTFRPSLVLRTNLPQKAPTEMSVPTDDEIKKLLKYLKVNNPVMELAVMLGAYCGLRRSEIAGLKWSDVDFEANTIHVQRAIVLNDNKQWVLKGTKTYSSDRIVGAPAVLMTVLKDRAPEDKSSAIYPYRPECMTGRFPAHCVASGIPKYHFHQLRHYFASVLLSLNIPNKYAMELTGHKTEYMLTRVYQHTFNEKQKSVRNDVTNYFDKPETPSDATDSDGLQHDLQHDTQNTTV